MKTPITAGNGSGVLVWLPYLKDKISLTIRLMMHNKISSMSKMLQPSWVLICEKNAIVEKWHPPTTFPLLEIKMDKTCLMCRL